MKCEKKTRIKGCLLLAILGSIICFVADMLLGAYMPSESFGSLPKFSEKWAIYEFMKEKQVREAKVFWGASFFFGLVGMFYHGVFAMTAYLYNCLSRLQIPETEQIAEKFFQTYICVAMPAAGGFLLMCCILFWVTIREKIDNKRSLAIVNPLVFMLMLVISSVVLPQTPLVNGIFGWGQQSVSLFLTFTIYYAAYFKNGVKREYM